ncbi:MAG: hypothetical protein AAGD10_01890 [Myxococcota bacterium]
MNRQMMCLGLFSSMAACGGVRDLRPPNVRGDALPAATEHRGKEAVEAMLSAHGGLDRWRDFNFVSARASDEWYNTLYWRLLAPYRDNPEWVAVAAYVHDFPNARVQFLGGKNEGEVWVSRGDQIWRKNVDEEAKVIHVDDKGIFTTFAHGFAYWPTMPFALATADSVAYVDTGEWEGRRYDRVLVSWDGLAPKPDIDQWILWIDVETKQLDRVWFTIRRVGRRAQGGYNLRHYQWVQGLKVPTVLEALLKPDGRPLHVYTYEDIEFSRRVDDGFLRSVR